MVSGSVTPVNRAVAVPASDQTGPEPSGTGRATRTGGWGPRASDGQVTASQLRAALAADALEVHYQPVVLLPARHVAGFEALARLRDRSGTVVPPAGFIGAAERSGLIVPLGLAVLRAAIREASRWRAGSTGLSTATVSVNVAPAQLEHRRFLPVVRDLLAEYGVPGSVLVLEITETAATSAGVRPLLDRLAALGVRIALDDFGTGFANLDNLRRLPVQLLKLDRSFVAGITRAGADRAIIRVTVDLAEALGLSVIAEGVETEQQADALVRLGCPAVQGFLFGRPGPDPERAAGAIGTRIDQGSPLARSRDERWSVEADAAVIAAARLLAGSPDRERAAVHALATELARRLDWPEAAIRATGRMALVHDLYRLAVDAALPGALAGVPELTELAGAGTGPGRPQAVAELDLVRRTKDVVRLAARTDPDLAPQALAAALRADPGWAVAESDPVLALAVRRVASDLPEIPAIDDILDDLDQRRHGRRGMEDRLRSLIGITRVLSSSRDTRELLRVALDEVRRIVGAASGSLERWEREAGLLRCLVNVGQLGPGEETFPADETYALADYAQPRRTLLTGLPYIHTVDDADADPEAVALLRRLHKYSSAAIPVYLEGRMWGQVWLATGVGEPPFTAGDIELLTSVATLIAGVIVQAENLDRVSRLAFEDPLTRVGNRRAVDDALDRLSRTATPVVMVLLDVDLLKRVNDVEGHDRGDQALIEVADSLSRLAMSWSGATVGSLGGDEFCLLVPNADPGTVVPAVRAALDQLPVKGGPGVSLGAAWGQGTWTSRELLARADEQLYAAKAAARGRHP